MMARRLSIGLLCAAAVCGSLVASLPVPSAAAGPCPDVEVVFARGSGEAPGVGGIGQPFVDELRSQIGGRSLTVYPVNYPASTDFSSPDFPMTVIDGIRDASSHIESMAANCPSTKEVLGGYSQGAAVAGYTTSAAVPPGVPASAVPPPMPPEVAAHVAAVTLFGTPSGQFLQKYNAPPLTIGPLYQPKTLELCAQGDPVCGKGEGDDFVAHTSYPVNGMTSQAADFAASHL
ncbi:cutinase family protein [Mycobacterium arosiense ATCC BAA-1401 = DSM 45069]|uniref:Cutinase family protein n=1 Tax=Mycobacterium arosiense ATCC BAA-1401 = DSM 45069 TaxID=1265311 RepID=A0A1W9ZC48_MYCAI|nr:cutinase family protein [Mycobacterium arosiense]ORA11404.1 cutinase family protein [Mycobacterium arosiense ATCC BAA-1401 = DSM 45069]